jgi:Ca-activated chloride channel homolog
VTSKRMGLVILLVVAAAGLVGCTGSSKSNSSSGLSSGDSTATGEQFRGKVATPAAGAKPAANPQPPLQQRDIVRTAALNVEVADVDVAAELVLSRARKVGGRVDGDNRRSSGKNRSAQLVLRVPPAALDDLINKDLKGLGTETNRTVTGDDVTAARADVDARVKALTTSVDRLRDFLKHSGTITDLVQLESQLSQREAELESTVAQQRALADQITLATLTVDLVVERSAVTRAGGGPTGFGSALGNGLHGLVVGVRWVLAVAGYALPFVLLVAVVLLPLLVIRRRRTSQIPAPAPAEL